MAIADDVEALRTLARMMLSEDSDVEIVGEAADGLEALALVEQAQPDVLLLDLSMPGADGLEVLEALSHLPSPPTVVVFSAFAAGRLAARAIAAGAVAYVEKGASAAELIAAVKQACAVR